MKCARTKAETHWRGVGIACAKAGWKIEVALTGNDRVDAWIRAGYDLGARYRLASAAERAQLATIERVDR